MLIENRNGIIKPNNIGLDSQLMSAEAEVCIDLAAELVKARPTLMRKARAIQSDEDLAKDLVQDTILKILTRPGQYKSQINGSFSKWALQVLKNHHIDQVRKSIRWVQCRLSEEIIPNHLLVRQEENEDYNDLLKKVNAALTDLNFTNPQQARCLSMNAHGFEYTEIAETLKITETTVRRHVSQGRTYMREKFGRPERRYGKKTTTAN